MNVTFNGREPVPYHFSIANMTDHQVESVVFAVPEINENQAAVLNVLLPDGTGDVLPLENNALNVTRDLTGISGDATAWVTVSVGTEQVWNSSKMLMHVGDLPAISETIVHQYPTALQDAIAQTSEALQGAQTAQQQAQETADGMPAQIEAALTAAKQSGEFNGPQGPRGETGPQGPQGEKGDKGEKGDTGDAFHIVKTYASRDEMNRDYAQGGVNIGEYVMIVSTVDDPDNAKVYIKGNQFYAFVVDMSGAAGIQGHAGPGVPRGGNAGQVLVKRSNADYDAEWVDLADLLGGE